jgi:predicted nucleic acid-binding Zn ribbon protein
MNIDELLKCTSLSECARLLFEKDDYSSREKVKHFLLENGIDDWKSWLNSHKIKYCECCGKPLNNNRGKFCSSSCAAKINNTKRKKENYCINCDKPISSGKKFCSNKCQREFESKEITTKWLNNEHCGCDKNGEISEFVKRYVLELHEHKCDVCGFNEKNPFTGNEILEIHHIDGDCFNNHLSNLQVLCPTHHAMTNNYGRRNYKSTRNRYKK